MHDSWVSYFRTEPPGFSSILRKSTKVLGSIRRVPFTEATQRHANIREDKGPSLGKKSKFLISAVLTLKKLRAGLRRRLKDRSDVFTETRGDWPGISKSSKKRTKLHFLTYQRMVSPRNKNWRKASMHMLSRKDLNSAELVTVRVRRRLLQPKAKCKQKKKRQCMTKNWIYS